MSNDHKYQKSRDAELLRDWWENSSRECWSMWFNVNNNNKEENFVVRCQLELALLMVDCHKLDIVAILQEA